jgi:hypothetical protein
MAAVIMRESPDMANDNSDPQVANGAQRAGRRNRKAPKSDESHNYEGNEDSNAPHNPKDAHASGKIDRSFSARAQNKPEGNLNYTTRKPLLSSEPSEESTTPRGLPAESSHLESSTAMPEIQVSSPPPAPGVSSAPARSNTTRSGPANGSRRDWAPDRSPLQKLEVTLTGISKEEKRARVQEAEMKARERIARKKAEQEKADLAAAAAREASTQPTQHERQPPSDTDRRSERKEVLVEGYRRNGHANAPQQRQPENTATRHSRTSSANPQYPAIRRPEDPQFARAEDASPSSAKIGSVPKRSVTVSGPAKPGPAININHSKSLSQAGPRSMQIPSALRTERANGLSPSPLAPQDSSESQSRPKNVSFDVPPPTPPPIFEWRGAQPARLGTCDFDLQNLDINRSKAWWEGGANNDRRKSRALPKNYKTPAQKLTGMISLHCLAIHFACPKSSRKILLTNSRSN